MTALEIRLILYAFLALVIIGGASWGTYTLTSHHYDRIMADDKLAQDQALQTAQQQVIAAQAARAAALAQAEKEHDQRTQADTVSRAAVIGSVRNLEAALHLGPVSSAVGHPGQPLGPTPSAGSDPELERAIAAVNAATDAEIKGCQHDSDHYAGILTLAPKKAVP